MCHLTIFLISITDKMVHLGMLDHNTMQAFYYEPDLQRILHVDNYDVLC